MRTVLDAQNFETSSEQILKVSKFEREIKPGLRWLPFVGFPLVPAYSLQTNKKEKKNKKLRQFFLQTARRS